MANVKISDLTEDTTPASGDFLESFDISASTSKKISIDNLLKVLMSSTGAWTSFTPTWTNITVGNGTSDCYYLKIGRLVFARYKFIMGSTSAMGTDPRVDLPVAAAASFLSTSFRAPYSLNIEDSGTGTYFGFARHRATSTGIELFVGNAAGTYFGASSITSTVPMTWTTNDSISFQIFYESAS